MPTITRLITQVARMAVDSVLSLAGMFSRLIPKRNGLVVFSQARDRYNGNSRYLFESLCAMGFDAVWLSMSAAQRSRIPERYQSCVLDRWSLPGIVCAVRAQWAVLSHGSGDFGVLWFALRHHRVLALWHAITVKQIGLLDRKSTSKMASHHLRKETHYYKAMIASSDVDRYITAAAHGVDVRKVHVTGLPKADQYQRALTQHRNARIHDPSFRVLYAPTFRDYPVGELFFPFSDFSITSLRCFLERNPGVLIYLRPHPNDWKSSQQAEWLQREFPEQIIFFSQQVCDDIDEVLYTFHAIITDYSSIFMEPVLGDTPCIFVPFDHEQYLATRGLAYDYDTITPGPKAGTCAALLEAIEQAQVGAAEWAQQRQWVAQLFFRYRDDGACGRIAKQILGLPTRYPEDPYGRQ